MIQKTTNSKWQKYGIEEWIKPENCYVDDYGRETNGNTLKVIRNSYREELFGRSTLSKRASAKGDYAIIDGNHRIQAHSEKFGADEPFPAIVHYDLSYQDEALLHTDLNKNRKNHTALDVFRSEVESGKMPESTAIDEMFQRHNIVAGKYKYKNQLGCIILVRKAWKENPYLIDQTLKIISKAWRDKVKAYEMQIITSVYDLLKHLMPEYIDNQLENRLIFVMKQKAPEQLIGACNVTRNPNFAFRGNVKEGNPMGMHELLLWVNFGLKKDQRYDMFPDLTKPVLREWALEEVKQ
jgi:hypothetical protein